MGYVEPPPPVPKGGYNQKKISIILEAHNKSQAGIRSAVSTLKRLTDWFSNRKQRSEWNSLMANERKDFT